VRTAGVEEDDRIVAMERSRLIFFDEKNRGTEAELLASLAWRGEHWNGRAMSSMATTVFGGFVSGSVVCREVRARRKGGVTAQREDKEEALGLQG
jgi:hypothetical protein